MIGLVKPENFHVFNVLSPCRSDRDELDMNYYASCVSREAVIERVAPDIFHIGSLFEGFHEDAVTDVPYSNGQYITSVTLYDLIPYILKDIYLKSPSMKAWYFRRLKQLSRADLILSISDSSKQEAVNYLGYDPERIVNASCAIDPDFTNGDASIKSPTRVLQKFGIEDGQYVMYTGGIDYRKNIEGLIHGYSLLPDNVRRKHRLVIVCAISPDARVKLERLVRKLGLSPNEVIFTGYVPSDVLVCLYKNASLFVFPSLHEGFGLPVLEAMTCGVTTIGARNSSIPEVLGDDRATFDSSDPQCIRDSIHRALTDKAFAKSLRAHATKQVQKFSWVESARIALAAMQSAYLNRLSSSAHTVYKSPNRPKLALITPVPPLQSGIADYAAELCPELSSFYDVDVVTDQPEIKSEWIELNCNVVSAAEFAETYDVGGYDRVVYQFGNSEFHSHMVEMLKERPGVVVMHDYFMSGMKYWRSVNLPNNSFVEQCIASDGYIACKELADFGPSHGIMHFKSNRDVVENAAGIIVHSNTNVNALAHDYGLRGKKLVRHVHQIRALAISNRDESRSKLGLSDSDFLIVSLGIVAPTKLTKELVEAFTKSNLSKSSVCHLVLVGRAPGEYGDQIRGLIDKFDGKASIKITEFVEQDAYDAYVAAADLAVQLRTSSRGETSRAVLDCMSQGVPVIVNKHGTFAELLPHTVEMIDDEFELGALRDAIDLLAEDNDRRLALGKAGLEAVRRDHAPAAVGRAYYDAIEQFTSHPMHGLTAAMKGLAGAKFDQPSHAEVSRLARLWDDAFWWGGGERFLDVSALCSAKPGDDIERGLAWAHQLLMDAGRAGSKLVPVYFDGLEGETVLREAANWMRALNGSELLPADPIVSRLSNAHFYAVDFGIPSRDDISVRSKAELLRKHNVSSLAFSIRSHTPSVFGYQNFEEIASFDQFIEFVLWCRAELIAPCVAQADEYAAWIENSNPGKSDISVSVKVLSGASRLQDEPVSCLLLDPDCKTVEQLFGNVEVISKNVRIEIVAFDSDSASQIGLLVKRFARSVSVRLFSSYATLCEKTASFDVVISDNLGKNGLALVLGSLKSDAIFFSTPQVELGDGTAFSTAVLRPSATIEDVVNQVALRRRQSENEPLDFARLEASMQSMTTTRQAHSPASDWRLRVGGSSFWRTTGEQIGNYARTNGESGYLVIGPYGYYSGGNFRLSIAGSRLAPLSEDFEVSVSHSSGQKVVKTWRRVDVGPTLNGYLVNGLSFYLPHSVDDLEIKVHVGHDDECIVSDVQIWPVD